MKRLWKALSEMLPTALKSIEDLTPTVLVVIGAAAVAVGVGMIYLPAGVIAGGVLAAFAGVVLIRGGGDDDEQ